MFWKDRSYDFVHLFINQVAVGMFGAVLLFVSKRMGGGTVTFCFGVVAFLLYMFVTYTSTWDIGAKESNAISHGRKELKPLTGALIQLVAYIPSLFVALFLILNTLLNGDGASSFLSAVSVASGVVAMIIDGMYLGMVSAFLEDGQSVWIYWYLLLIIPGLLVSGAGYFFGAKGILFTKINSFVYPKSDRPTKQEMKDRENQNK